MILWPHLLLYCQYERYVQLFIPFSNLTVINYVLLYLLILHIIKHKYTVAFIYLHFLWL